MDLLAVSSAVRGRRRELGKKQREIAAAAGVSLATIGRLEQGATPMLSAPALAAVARALGWPPDALDRIASGEDPSTLPTVDADPPRAAPGESELLALRSEVVALRATQATMLDTIRQVLGIIEEVAQQIARLAETSQHEQ